METFRNIFDSWISKKVDYQISEIDRISKELNIDVEKWFNKFKRRSSDYSGLDALNEFLSDFTFYISGEFQKLLLQYLLPKGFNIYNEPYLSVHIQYDNGFFLDKEDTKEIKKHIKQLTLEQKQELLKNKLFSYLVDETKIKILTKKETRFLKLKTINEYSGADNK